jgi:hypothetical protein
MFRGISLALLLVIIKLSMGWEWCLLGSVLIQKGGVLLLCRG